MKLIKKMQESWATLMKVLSSRLWRERTLRPPLSDPLRSRILMFHQICPDGVEPADEYGCTITQLFNSIRWHREAGFTFVSLDELLSMREQDALEGKCVLTFDDGYEGVLTLAEPALTKEHIPFVAYICLDFLDTPGYLTRTQLQQLSRNSLCCVGSHSLSHTCTRFLSKKALRRELLESKSMLESLLGCPVRHFAFPFGSAYACSRRDIAMAGAAGYDTAALTTNAPISSLLGRERYRLPRMNLPHIAP